MPIHRTLARQSSTRRKEQGAALVVEVAAQRHRAYTLFVRAYDEVRRAVSFLRWRKGDADDIIPSIYSVRAARPRPEPSR
jgi:hypothetical protein